MIQLNNVIKSYGTRRGKHTVLKGVNLTIEPGEKVGILGKNGAGKSTLIRMISGAELPTAGVIRRRMSVSWPLAFGGVFQGSLTGLDNLRFICRVYEAEVAPTLEFVEEFAELGTFLHEPVKNYSSGMQARLAFALSMAIDFDCFLIDEIISVGDARFHEKCRRELFENRRDRAMIIVSHEEHNIREHCDRACVLDKGIVHHFPDIENAYQYYNEQ